MLRFLFLFFCLSTRAFAIDEADLLPVDEAFKPEITVSADAVQLSFAVAPGYYLYKERISLASMRESELSFGALELPPGEPKTDEFFGEMHVFHKSFSGSAALNFAGPRPNIIAFKLKYQGCADAGVCYPPQTRSYAMDLPGDAPAGITDDSTSLPVAPETATSASNPLGLPGAGVASQGGALPEAQAFGVEALATSPGEILVRFSFPKDYYLYRDNTSFALEGAIGLTLKPEWPASRSLTDEHFGKVEVYFGGVEVPLKLDRPIGPAQSANLLVTFQGCKENSVCYPLMTRNIKVDLPIASQAYGQATSELPPSPSKETMPNVPANDLGLLGALLLAVLGGLILNLMPCVLPILSLKALSLAESGASHAQAKRQALAYTAGVLISFVLLGAVLLSLKAAGQALGWGFQLQQPWVVGLLAYVMLTMGLSLSGVITIGAAWGGVGAKLAEQGGSRGAFFTGVLACVVASPCTAPFMGPALGYGFTHSASAAIAVLLALGLGLALPFLLIGFVPAIAARIPKPGAWMELLKQLLAFPLYLTAIWLLWVLGHQTGVNGMGLALLGLLLLTAGLWWLERQLWSNHSQAGAHKALAWVLIALSLWPLAVASRQTAASTRQADERAVAYDPAELARLRAEKIPVFVDMTADWCITCKVNEANAINTYRVGQAMTEAKMVYMIGDYTNADPQITEYLQQFKAVGVPLYVVYPRSGSPVVLPQLLTQDIVLKAIANAR